MIFSNSARLGLKGLQLGAKATRAITGVENKDIAKAFLIGMVLGPIASLILIKRARERIQAQRKEQLAASLPEPAHIIAPIQESLVSGENLVQTLRDSGLETIHTHSIEQFEKDFPGVLAKVVKLEAQQAPVYEMMKEIMSVSPNGAKQLPVYIEGRDGDRMEVMRKYQKWGIENTEAIIPNMDTLQRQQFQNDHGMAPEEYVATCKKLYHEIYPETTDFRMVAQRPEVTQGTTEPIITRSQPAPLSQNANRILNSEPTDNSEDFSIPETLQMPSEEEMAIAREMGM